MSFLPSVPPRAVERAAPIKANRHARSHHIDTTVPGSEPFHRGLIDQRPALVEEKLKLHARIIDEFNLTVLEKLPRAELVKQVHSYVANYVRTEKISLNQKELEIFSEEIIDEMTGYGPIEPLLKDPTVTDILINTHKLCFVERFGKLYETKVYFKDEAHLLRIIGKIVAGVGRRVDEVLADGGRTPAGWYAREHCHPANRHRRTAGINPQIFRAAIRYGTPDRNGDDQKTNGRCYESGCQRPYLGTHQRRDR